MSDEEAAATVHERLSWLEPKPYELKELIEELNSPTEELIMEQIAGNLLTEYIESEPEWNSKIEEELSVNRFIKVRLLPVVRKFLEELTMKELEELESKARKVEIATQLPDW